VSLFQRSVRSEVTSNASVVFSTLVIVWLSVLLVRLLGEAAAGRIGADVVLGIASFSLINALPTVIAVALFVAVLTTVTRNYRDSEMVVWFASGLSLKSWVRPVLLAVLPAAALVGVLTLLASPWSQKQIADYRLRFEQRSDVSKVTPGQFLESSGIDRVFYVESATEALDKINHIFARWYENGRLYVLLSGSGEMEDHPNGDRFMVLSDGSRLELTQGTGEFRLMQFEKYGVRMERDLRDGDGDHLGDKARTSVALWQDGDLGAMGELFRRLSLPLLTINLALFAIPLGAVNPRRGKSGHTIIALLFALAYLNLVNLGKAWVSQGLLSAGLMLLALHGGVALISGLLLRWRARLGRR